MKKIYKIMWLSILLLPSLAWSNLDDGMDMIASTGALFGVLIVVVTVALWMLPAAFAGLVYTGQKKKAEQMHEEVGLKAAILALLAAVLGVAMAFYIVGTIGQYAGGTTVDDLEKGNGYLINTIVDPAVKRMNDPTYKITKDISKPEALDEGIQMVASVGKLFGMIIVIISVTLWLLPAAFAVLVYTGQKKKAEQMHEEVGLKAAILALLAAVLGVAMSFYIVGTIGKYAKGATAPSGVTLKQGNKYFLEAVIGKGADKILKPN